MKNAVIIGATSGLGRRMATELIARGWRVGVAGRRGELLDELRTKHPEAVETQTLDLRDEHAPQLIEELIEKVGGIDLFILSSGVGKQNTGLDISIDTATAQTNVVGFIRAVNTAFNYFRSHNRHGHIAVISSVAGTKGIGVAASYSATKRFQTTYIEALDQLSKAESRGITFTDIRPGFTDTDILNKEHHYPMLLDPDRVAKSAVDAVLAGERVAIIDWRYRALVHLWRLIPSKLWARMNVRMNK